MRKLFIGAYIYCGFAAVAFVGHALAEQLDMSGEPISPIPLEMELDARKVTLGEMLFHETRLSKNKKMSCASCYDLKSGGAATGMGFAFDIAENGQIACEKARDKNYDIILMDGYTATTSIRTLITDGVVRDAPIIALTANAMKGDREKCLAAGMNDYITKPVKKTSLNDAIAKWLQPRSEGDQEKCLAAGMDDYLAKEIWLPKWQPLLLEKLEKWLAFEGDTSKVNAAT